MGVFQHLGRTGKVRADFLGDECERINGQTVRILIKGIVIGRVWLARGEKIQELLTVNNKAKFGRAFVYEKAGRKKRVRKETTCRFHGEKLLPNGRCPRNLEPLGRSPHEFSFGAIGNTD